MKKKLHKDKDEKAVKEDTAIQENKEDSEDSITTYNESGVVLSEFDLALKKIMDFGVKK